MNTVYTTKQIDRDYYIALAREKLGSLLASQYDSLELVCIGKEYDKDIVDNKLNQLGFKNVNKN